MVILVRKLIEKIILRAAVVVGASVVPDLYENMR